MIRDFNAPLKNLDGEPFEDLETLHRIALFACTTVLPKDQHQSMEEKIKLYGLAQKIHPGGEIELTAEQIVLLKTRIAAFPLSPIAIGRAIDLLEAN